MAGSLAIVAQRVGENDDRALEALGPMNRHHPDPRICAGGLALDLDRMTFVPGQKAGETRGCGLLVAHRLPQERVYALLRLDPEPGEQPCAAAMAGEQTLDKLVGAEEVGLPAQIIQNFEGWAMPIARVPQRLPEKAPARPGEPVEIPLGPAEERRAKCGGQREVVFGKCQKGQGGDDVACGQL